MIRDVADSAGLTAAFAAAGGGDTIRLAPGTYGPVLLAGRDFEPALTIISADRAQPAVFAGRVHLKGVEGVTLEALRITVPDLASANRVLRIDASRDVTVRDVHVTGRITPAGEPGTYDPAQGPVTTPEQYGMPLVGYPSGVGVGVKDSARVRLDGLEVEKFVFGLSLGDVTDTTVANSHIHDMRHDAIRFSDARNLVIENNLIEGIKPFLNTGGSTRYKDHGDHIQFWATHADFGVIGLTIRGNVLLQGDGSYTHGIFGRYALIGRDRPEDVTLQGIRIHDNIINTGHRHGIALSDVEDVEIFNNTLLPPPRSAELKATGHVPLINITVSGKPRAGGGLEANKGKMPTDIRIHDNIVVRDDARVIDSYKIAPALYDDLGIVVGRNTVLSIRPALSTYWGRAYPALVDRGIRAAGDLAVPPAAAALIVPGTGARGMPDWIARHLAGSQQGSLLPALQESVPMPALQEGTPIPTLPEQGTPSPALPEHAGLAPGPVFVLDGAGRLQIPALPATLRAEIHAPPPLAEARGALPPPPADF